MLVIGDKVIYFNPSKEIPITIRVYDRVTGGYGGSDKFSFITLPVMHV
jgi:hypothetical protein